VIGCSLWSLPSWDSVRKSPVYRTESDDGGDSVRSLLFITNPYHNLSMMNRGIVVREEETPKGVQRVITRRRSRQETPTESAPSLPAVVVGGCALSNLNQKPEPKLSLEGRKRLCCSRLFSDPCKPPCSLSPFDASSCAEPNQLYSPFSIAPSRGRRNEKRLSAKRKSELCLICGKC
jgi:hypothetical protein